jgi:hypothetical protein
MANRGVYPGAGQVISLQPLYYGVAVCTLTGKTASTPCRADACEQLMRIERNFFRFSFQAQFFPVQLTRSDSYAHPIIHDAPSLALHDSSVVSCDCGPPRPISLLFRNTC